MWYLRQTRGERRQLPVRFRFKYRTRGKASHYLKHVYSYLTEISLVQNFSRETVLWKSRHDLCVPQPNILTETVNRMECPTQRKRKTFLAPISDRDRVRLRDSEGTESIRTYPVRCSSSSTGTERDELRLLKVGRLLLHTFTLIALSFQGNQERSPQ